MPGAGPANAEPTSELLAALHDGPILTRRTLLRRASVLTVAGTLGPTLLAACGGSSSGPTPTGGTTAAAGGGGGGGAGTVTFGMASLPQDLNILRAFNIPSPTVLSLALEGLTTFTDEMALQPVLAQAIHHPEPTVYVYKIKPDVRFHDGSTLTAEDVAFSFQWQILPKNGTQLGLFFNSVKKVEATGKLELTVELKAPDGLWPYTPAHTAGLIQSKKFLQTAGSNAGTPGNLPIGTGPFKITGFSPSSSVTLERFDQYHGTKPALSGVSMQGIADDSSRLLAMRNGSINGTFDVPYDQLSTWKQIPSATVSRGSGLDLFYIAFNVKAAPFNDIHVRRAIAHSIDTAGLIKSQLSGAGEPATGFVPPLFFKPLGVSPSTVEGWYAKNPQYKFDLDAAKSELKQSAHSSGFTTVVPYPEDYPRMGAALQNLQQNMKPMGVNIQLKEMTEDQWLAILNGNRDKLGMSVVVYFPDYPDPADYAGFLTTPQIKSGWNLSNYSNAHVDQLMNKQAASQSIATRVQCLREVLAIAQQELPVLPVWIEDNLVALDNSYHYSVSPVFYLQPWAAQVTKA
jgi:peptide/nickel transport system substrate-binding protein